MNFQLAIESHTPLTPVEDPEEATMAFLSSIGYFPKSRGSRNETRGVRSGVPFKLFYECFLKRMDKVWTIEELAVKLHTTKPTIYRHINKLKGFDLLEEASANEQNKKGYRIRYGNLAKAWNFTESHVEMTMENYRKSVDHIQSLVERGKEGG